ncbi:ABC transporter permease [Anaeromicropila populeti]|uniref:Putative ABC transport system permease protein n=1 Tax=Anaeromicropila populeti TaxID=37658 RepID=A0A1I6IWC5_9FIRM|nr:ABC transporter permease [Anaeromicropila populeti]SFR71046.1 putative ABC transport system permease protein [Anaeromicropila populeti]
MNIFQAFRLALKSIIANKMRSVLTMLGMIIGVGSVIMIMGLMQGVTNYFLESFAEMGINMLTVTVSSTGTRSVSEEEMFAITEENADIFEGVSPTVTSSFTLKNGSTSISSTVTGVSETYQNMNHLELSQGRFINYADIVNRQANCVVGTYIIKELFENNNVLGETISVDGESFTIVGIVEETADGEEGSADDCFYAAYTKIARKSFTGSIKNYTFAAHDSDMVEEAETILDNFLYEKFKDEDLYSISTLTALLEEVDSMTSVLGAVLGGIAGISLLVAGIGIMNIMLVSVTERTQEIGIRKSLGAKRKDILCQFIIEAGSISALGGLIGIIMGASLVIYLGSQFGVNASPTINSIIMSFSISVAIGIIFGYMPARKAAKLNPIDALRSD